MGVVDGKQRKIAMGYSMYKSTRTTSILPCQQDDTVNLAAFIRASYLMHT